jgi:hypothetical protein
MKILISVHNLARGMVCFNVHSAITHNKSATNPRFSILRMTHFETMKTVIVCSEQYKYYNTCINYADEIPFDADILLNNTSQDAIHACGLYTRRPFPLQYTQSTL